MPGEIRLNLHGIVKSYLKEHGFDGLYSDDCDEPCGCHVDDLAVCGEFCANCTPAKEDNNFHMVPCTHEPGTSVIRWTRYDGTQKTFPHPMMIVRMAREGLLMLAIGMKRAEDENLIWWRIREMRTRLEDYRNKTILCYLPFENEDFVARPGDVWAYIPEPPEGM